MALTPQQLVSGGVMPIGFVEPLNDWQKSGLTGLTQPATAGNDMYAMADQLTRFGQQITKNVSSEGISEGEFLGRLNQYMNPYLDQVIGRTTNSLNEAAAEARARIMAQQGFRKAFGDTSLGVQRGEVDKGLMKNIGDATANLSYAGFNDARDASLGQLNTERDRALQGAGQIGNFAQIAQALGLGLDNRAQTDLTNRLGAGAYVQSQNQRYLDALNPEITGTQNYDSTRLQQLAGFLDAFKPTQFSSVATENPNFASRAGNAATALGGIDWSSIFG